MNRMLNKKYFSFVLAAGLFTGVGLFATPGPGLAAHSQQADNSSMNKGDADKGAVTADQQKMNSSDRMIVQRIRSEVVKDKSLSTYAHNVKIIAQGGKVTLKGPVRSQDEKASIETKAAAIAGEGNVTNQIDVVPPKS